MEEGKGKGTSFSLGAGISNGIHPHYEVDGPTASLTDWPSLPPPKEATLEERTWNFQAPMFLLVNVQEGPSLPSPFGF